MLFTCHGDILARLNCRRPRAWGKKSRISSIVIGCRLAKLRMTISCQPVAKFGHVSTNPNPSGICLIEASSAGSLAAWRCLYVFVRPCCDAMWCRSPPMLGASQYLATMVGHVPSNSESSAFPWKGGLTANTSLLSGGGLALVGSIRFPHNKRPAQRRRSQRWGIM